jgi:tripartite-type tricarboxylate transporter receptor subunit TctC
VPAGTPDAVVARIHEVFGRVLKQPSVIAALRRWAARSAPRRPKPMCRPLPARSSSPAG